VLLDESYVPSNITLNPSSCIFENIRKDDLGSFRSKPPRKHRPHQPAEACSRSRVRRAVRAVVRTYPDIRIELTVEDSLADIVAGGFDAGIRLGELLQQDMVAVRVTPDLRGAVVGSPACFASRAVPRTPADLREHQCIAYRWMRGGPYYRWPSRKRGKMLEVDPVGAIAVNDVDVMVSAALDGAGLAYTLEGRVAEHVSAGRLVRVLEDWCAPYPGFSLYYPSRRRVLIALRTLVDFLRSRSGSPAA